ncbi:MAG: M28 family peptidase, partial [Pirellulales bacterium]
MAAAFESINAGELRRHIDVLADDTMEGRNVGSRGGQAAGGYIVTQLERLKMRGGAADQKFYQPLPTGGRNILALLPGSDPQLAREVIVVGAHYDHVGYGSSRTSYGPYGYIHNGADDNASGTAGLLELAEACTMLPTAPARTILFTWWDGEEHGLLGSKHWLSQPTLARSSVVFMVNLDMIGRAQGGKVQVLGTRTAPGLRELVSRRNDGGLTIDFAWELEGNSDHWPFVKADVPILMFHTGLHADYHRPSDDAERINADDARQVTRLVLATLLEAAGVPHLPKFRRSGLAEASEATRARFEQPLAPPPGRLGVVLAQKPTIGARADASADTGVALSEIV